MYRITRKLAALVAAGIIILSAPGCKTTQENMYDAYAKAIEGENAKDAENADIYKNKREMGHQSVMLGENDSIDVAFKHIRITKDGGGINENIRRYCVVVGQFKQLFNAKSMRERLADDGYPGCFVAQTSEPYYFVIVKAYDSINEAAEMLHKVEKDSRFKFKAPLPFILSTNPKK